MIRECVTWALQNLYIVHVLYTIVKRNKAFAETITVTGNFLQFRPLFSFCSQIKDCFLVWNSQNACQNIKQGRPQKQSDLDLPRLPRPFTSVPNFRAFTILSAFTKYEIFFNKTFSS